MLPTPTDVLRFWFQDDPQVRRPVWFQGDAGFDTACQAYAAAVEAAAAGRLDHWAATAEGALALVLLLDQMPRNLYRGTAQAFAADPHARRIARMAIGRGFDQALTPVQRGFLYLPFEHAEDLADQDEAVRLFTPLGGQSLDYALRHRDAIRRFGRFPHRNAALGRVSTPQEAAYLAEPGAGF
jgi:uncharacterized protein (DUF924 family)